MESQYCLYYKNDRLQFGWIREVRKNKPVILPAQGKEFSCSSNRLEYIWNGSAFQNEKETLAYLSEKTDETIARSTEIELDVIHDLCETGIPYTLEDLADNFLDDPENGWSRVSLLINIKNDRKYFQQKKSQFFARSQEEIQKLEEELEKKRENERRLVKEKEWVELLRKSELPDISTDDTDHWNTFLHRILNFLRYMEHSQERDYFSMLFQCQVSESIVTERRLLEVLAVAGIKLSWGSLILSRVDAHSAYEEEELAAISEIKTSDIWNGFYDVETRDERHLSTYTVDNAETLDYDDAISLEKKEDGWALRIHIADVASFIGKENPLFKKGESRMSSLYTIKETLPMFHPDLSENIFSLRENSDRPALTFEAKIDLTGDLTAFQLYRSIINVDQNLS